MILLPKPRGFWDYGLFALGMTGLLMLLFSTDASDGVGWADVGLAFGASVLCVFATIAGRRAEKATWIARPTRYVIFLVVLGAVGFIFGAVYADTYFFHPKDMSFSRLPHDIVLVGVVTPGLLWSFLRRRAVSMPG